MRHTILEVLLIFQRRRLSGLFTSLLSHNPRIRTVVWTLWKSRYSLSLILPCLDEIVATVQTIKIFKEWLVNQNKILIHLQRFGSHFFKNYLVKSLIVYVIRWIIASSEIFNPFLNPFLIDQVKHICVLLVLFKLVVRLKFSLPPIN
jgi:hypothetical protein